MAQPAGPFLPFSAQHVPLQTLVVVAGAELAASAFGSPPPSSPPSCSAFSPPLARQESRAQAVALTVLSVNSASPKVALKMRSPSPPIANVAPSSSASAAAQAVANEVREKSAAAFASCIDPPGIQVTKGLSLVSPIPVRVQDVAAVRAAECYKEGYLREWYVMGLTPLSTDKRDRGTFLTKDQKHVIKIGCDAYRPYVQQEASNLIALALRGIKRNVIVMKDHFPFEKDKLNPTTAAFLGQWNYFQASDAYVLISEFHGWDLSHSVLQTTLWGKGHFVPFVESLTSFIEELREHDLEHGDLKPENILYSPTDPPGFFVTDMVTLKPIAYYGVHSQKPRYWHASTISFRDPASSIFTSSSETSDLWSFAWTCVTLIRQELHFRVNYSNKKDENKDLIVALQNTLGPPSRQYTRLQQNLRKGLDNEELTYLQLEPFTAFYDSHQLEQLPLEQATGFLGKNLLLMDCLVDIHKVAQQPASLIVKFLEGILKWDPSKRTTPRQIREECVAIRAAWKPSVSSSSSSSSASVVPPPTKK